MLALIDADLLVYRIGFTTEDVDEGIMRARVRESVNLILEATQATEFKMYLTADDDPTAFRKRIYPEYKAHRLQPKPKHYRAIREHLQGHYDAEVCTGIEADDALGIHQTQFLGQNKSIIVSIDKDLHQIAGLHYNFVKDLETVVEPFEGLKYFYTQLLTGDSSDNIKGVWKCGPVKAAKILEGAETEEEMFWRVYHAYGNEEEMLLNGRCLWIWKQPEDDWRNHWDELLKSRQDS